MVRGSARLAGEPGDRIAGAPPARRSRRLASCRLARSGSSGRRGRGRGTRRCDSAKRKSSSPLAVRSAFGAAAPAAAVAGAGWCRLRRTPCCRAARCSRRPPWPRGAASARARRRRGSRPPRPSPCRGCRAPCELSRTARRTRAWARRRKRWRFPRLLPPGFRRRSTMYMRMRPRVRPQPACFTRMYHSTRRRTCRSV